MPHTLLLRLVGPMQSWGTRSRFDERDTELEPSKSGVLGLLCAAMGIDRSDWNSLAPLTAWRMGVRVDQEGVLRRDYHTAQNVLRADGSGHQPTAVSNRYYLADAAFLVGLEGEDHTLLEKAYHALANPVWPLSLGRKSFVPSQAIWLQNGLVEAPLENALRDYPISLQQPPSRLVLEAQQGSLRMDQPIASFEQRRFGVRFVRVIPWEVNHVSKPA